MNSPGPPDPAVGERVRALRLWRQMTLAEVAGLSGVSAAYLSMAERGLRSLDRRSMETHDRSHQLRSPRVPFDACAQLLAQSSGFVAAFPAPCGGPRHSVATCSLRAFER